MTRHSNTTTETLDPLRQLDAFLNARIVSGPAEHQRRWWNVKCAAKRHFSSLPAPTYRRSQPEFFAPSPARRHDGRQQVSSVPVLSEGLSDRSERQDDDFQQRGIYMELL